MKSKLGVECLWTVKERLTLPISRKEIWHPVVQRHNVFTTNGITQLASAISGNYQPPIYLILANNASTLPQAVSIGEATVVTSVQVDQSGDSQICISIGQANQETLTFTSSGPNTGGGWIYFLSTPCVYAHSLGDKVVRQVNENDSMNNILGEQQYDAVNSPGLRSASIAGYSSGPGNWITQYYFTATSALFYISDVGLSETQIIGSGSLHNHVNLGYDHTAGVTDVEIDGQLTLINI